MRLAFQRLCRRLCICLLAIGSFTTAIAAERNNVVIILADDMGYGDIGVHDCDDIPTPSIASHAKAAVSLPPT